MESFTSLRDLTLDTTLSSAPIFGLHISIQLGFKGEHTLQAAL
jgi:hypothetical protein